MIFGIIVCIFLAVLTGYLSYGNLASFDIVSFVDVLGVLLNVSSIIFAIIGAWIAIIYPNAIKNPEDIKSKKGLQEIRETSLDADYLSELFQIVLLSAFVIISVIAIQVGLPLLKAYSYFDLDKNFLKSVAVTYMIFLSLMQITSILVVVEKNFGLLKRVREKKEDNIIDHDV